MVNHLPSKVLRILFVFSLQLVVSLQKKKYLEIELMLTLVIKTENPYKYLENHQPINILNVFRAYPGENMEGVIY